MSATSTALRQDEVPGGPAAKTKDGELVVPVPAGILHPTWPIPSLAIPRPFGPIATKAAPSSPTSPGTMRLRAQG